MRKNIKTPDVVGIVLAGGAGERMSPLSDFITKPSISIGGMYTFSDFVTSNLVNSVITHNYFVVQSNPEKLMIHLQGYANAVAQMRGQFINILTPGGASRAFLSDGHSLLNTRRSINFKPYKAVLVVMSDQIYRLDYGQLIGIMNRSNADGVMVYQEVPSSVAKNRFGVLEVDDSGKVLTMEEKPDVPKEMPNKSGYCCANTAIYLIKTESYLEMLNQMQNLSAVLPLSKTGIQWLIKNKKVVALNFADNDVPTPNGEKETFFADAGVLGDYYKLNMDMCQRGAPFNLFNPLWTLHTSLSTNEKWLVAPPHIDKVKYFAEVLLGLNVIIQDDVTVSKAVISTGCVIERNSSVVESIILPKAKIGENVEIFKCVIDEDVVVPSNTKLNPTCPPINTRTEEQNLFFIKNNCEEDIEKTRLPVISKNGVLFIPRGYKFE